MVTSIVREWAAWGAWNQERRPWAHNRRGRAPTVYNVVTPRALCGKEATDIGRMPVKPDLAGWRQGVHVHRASKREGQFRGCKATRLGEGTRSVASGGGGDV